MNTVFSQSIQHALIQSGIFHESNSYLYNFLIYHIRLFYQALLNYSLGIGLLFNGTKKTFSNIAYINAYY